MIRRLSSILCALFCVFSACAGTRCDGAKPSGAPTDLKASAAKPLATIRPPRGDLRLVVMTDPLGYLEPCGCQQRPLGGLDKLATVVREARDGAGVPTLLVSAGDFTLGTELRPEDAEQARAQEAMRARTFVEIWQGLQPVAITPGPLDLAQPPPALHELSELAGYPWLVDNAHWSDAKKKAPVDEGRIVEGGGHKVGIFGIVAPDAVHRPSAGITLQDDLAAIAAAKTEALRAQGAEVVIALVSGDRRTARSIANRGPDVVVMGGVHVEEPLPPAVVGNAVIVHAGQQGQYAVQLDLKLGERDAGVREWEDASNWTRRVARKDLERQIAERRERILTWDKDPKVDRAELDAQRARLTELERERDDPKPPTFTGRWFFADLVALAPEVAGDRSVGAQIDAHDQKVNEHNRVALADRMPLPAAPGAPAYAGSESCASCHREAYAWWKTTKHGHAYKTLQDVHKEYNLSCVGCHVVGYNQPGGSTVTHVDKLENVGCESCHGAGSLHNAQPKQAGLIAKVVPESTCLGCHTHEHSDRFAYTAFRQLLIVPGHGSPGDRQ